ITKKVGEQGKLYGSVTAQEICSRLQDQGVEVDRRKIQLSEPIKALGEFQVPVKLHAEVMAQIKVKVVPEEAPEKKEEAQPESDAPADAAAEATGKTPETEQTEKESS
ncbi:MAG: 50S ribosomal protein L9, partial [Nitrospinaceae bacterium]|nr:50S ribosomal protein L9 [Nitrospinaceae bacterium]NIR54558.1 50S ribosomal protein L9 [Nitrospinaceae bacterium]NIS84977.1 50S ribosomal protein L9 [Nitrospinaceae bacterium]NIT84076.1 50S ribosomal protein L9 [Nitrospinaceae bacterium]NIU44060.1 50S ribosomal protein L9 [Nitrospinaceae bacterium]